MTHSPDNKYTFRNIEPIQYLKNFNKMVDGHQRSLTTDTRRSQLKIMPLSKFPLPQYYEKMEGIFQNINKKKDDQTHPKDVREQLEEQQFMRHHNEFMRKVLTKFIVHNESRQKNYEKQKQFHRQNMNNKNHWRSLSEPKFKIKKENKHKHDNLDVITAAKATQGTEYVAPQTETQKQEAQILPKLKPRKKQSKIHAKKDYQIEEYLINRKLNSPNNPEANYRSVRPQVKTSNTSQTKPDLMEQIVNLQLKQASKQQNFAVKIQKVITGFETKMDIQIHAINYFNIWQQPDLSNSASNEASGKLKSKLGQSRDKNYLDDHASYQIKIRNYMST